MGRRQTNQTDSLELLLDTICNTFGGVLFIAILVVILLQTTNPFSSQAVEAVAPEIVEQVQNHADALTADLAALKETKSAQERLLEQFAPDEIRVQLGTRAELRELCRDLEEKRDRLRTDTAETRQRIEQGDAEMENVQQALQSAREKADKAAAHLEAERKSRMQEIRMPVVHAAGLKREVGLILRYGRMYVWHRYDDRGNRLGLNTDEFVVVGEEDGALVTRPNPTAGIRLNASPQTRASIRARLRSFDPNAAYMVVVARPDSFPHFRHLHDALIDLGFEYRLMPLSSEGNVADRGGRGGKVQ